MKKMIGKKIVHYKTVGSTNDEARRLIKQGEGEGLVVIADNQTAGKGKPGSRWFSPPGNLYFSAVVKPYKNPKDLAPVTLLSALAARAMISKVSKLPVVIKWPNDLLIRGKKVGGILTEGLASGHLIIGLGININNDRRTLPEELKESATSLKIETGRKISLKKCEALLIDFLDVEYRAFLQKNND